MGNLASNSESLALLIFLRSFQKPETSEKLENRLQSPVHRCHCCDLVFDSSQQLDLHLRSHLGTAGFQCQTCGKEFLKLDNLLLHQKLHLGQKDYVCNLCDRSYFTRSGLLVRLAR